MFLQILPAIYFVLFSLFSVVLFCLFVWSFRSVPCFLFLLLPSFVFGALVASFVVFGVLLWGSFGPGRFAVWFVRSVVFVPLGGARSFPSFFSV